MSMVRAVPLLAVALASLAPAAASGATTSARAPESVREGTRFAVTGKVRPVRRGLKAVLMDESQGRAVPASPKVKVKPSGRYALRSFPYYEPFDPPLRVHILRRGSVYSRSAAFTVDFVQETRNTFRAVYVVTSDRPGPSHPTPGTDHAEAIAHEAEVANEWFHEQTGMRPRWRRTPGGRVEVATVRIGASAAEFAGDDGDAANHRLRRELDAKLDLGARELPIIWIDGEYENGPCGEYGTFPPQLVIWERACGFYPSMDSTSPTQGGTSHLFTHELTHAFGAAFVCVTHSDGRGHVTDDPADILYAGPEKLDLENLALDRGRDDYYMTGRADCPGIENSPFWVRNAAR